LNAVHDVFVVLIDSAFAFDLPPVSAWWIDAFDVETGRSRLISRRPHGRWRPRGRVAERGRADGEGSEHGCAAPGHRRGQSDIALMEFVIERRLRKG
jgi:hypothetical protein